MSEFAQRKLTTGSGVLIGLPTLGRPVPMEWAMAFKSLGCPMNYTSHNLIIKGRPIDDARNQIAQAAIDLKSKYTFFLGDDVVVPPDTLRQLIYRMEQDKNIGIVGAVYCSKSIPAAPLIFRELGRGSYWDWKIGEYIECGGLGMDATLIRTDIFRELKGPWFKTVDENQFKDNVNNADQWTEDLYFCKRVIEETPYKIMCDTSLQCKHWDVYSDKYYELPKNSQPFRRRAVTKERKAVDIGCGPLDRSEEFPDFELVRVDIREECNPDYRCDVRNLPFATGEFDLVFSSHVLEHFGREEWEEVLDEWIRILKPEGELILCLPNIYWAIEFMMGKNPDNMTEWDALNVFYGAQSNPYDFHYNGFWPARIENHLRDKYGFNEINFQFAGYNMMLNARRT